MKRILHCIGVLALSAHAQTLRTGDTWQIENRALKVTVNADTARMSVLEKESGTLWQQEDPARQNAGADKVGARRAPRAVLVDGNPEEWMFIPHAEYVWLPWKGENGEKNCSGGAKLMWDDRMVYLYVRVRDDNVAFGGEATAQWWESDSVEFWVDSVQIGLHLAPAGREVAVNARGEEYAGSKVGIRPVTDSHLPGYELEVAMPLDHFPVLKSPEPGTRFSFAIGINDADPAPGAPVKRDRQTYYPPSWTHSAPATFATAVLADSAGAAPERTRENDRSANASGGRISELKPGAKPNSLEFQYLVQRGQISELPLRVVLQLVGDQPFLDVSIDCVSGADTPMKAFDFPSALYPPEAESYFMGVADYTNGRYLPVSDPLCRNRTFCVGGSDLPFVLVTDGTRGMSTVLLTPWDAAVRMQTRTDDVDRLGFPGLHWLPQKGTWGDTRRGRLVFFAQGGHVTACKIYRELAAEQGLVRTFARKAEAKPNVRKLFGAVNWWGASGLSFVREAVAEGMTRGLLNGRPNPADMVEIAKLGWLVGEYDNYEDINDSDTIDRAKAPVKEHAVVKADGEFMTAWITRDKDMNPVHTYMKQCTGVMTKCARVVIPKLLDVYPYNTRFLDVTTATGLKECHSVLHPATRLVDQRNRERLCAYVGDELGLVAGGEHGRYWDVPYLDYHEGMMGGAMYSWPAGYLRDVETRDGLDERYLKYSIDPANRVPLFELVFHDCVVNYWYWGACSDYLHQIAPELTDRKTAMNVLYGTPPMMWAHSHGLRWQVPEEREKMLEIYRNVCKLHEVVADQEMLSHEFLTPDRNVQRTTFADGTVCTANFGDEPYTLGVADSVRGAVVLRLNDFHVRGQHVEQWRLSSDVIPPAIETFVRTDTCLFADSAGGEVRLPAVSGEGRLWATLVGPGRLQVSVGAGGRAALDLPAWNAAWRDEPAAAFESNRTGDLIRRLPEAKGKIELAAEPDAKGSFVVLIGDAARRPDVTLTGVRITAGGEPVVPDVVLPADAVLDISASVRNNGLESGRDFSLVLRLDGASGTELARKPIPALAPGADATVSTRFAAARADGTRRVVALLEATGRITQSGRLRAEAPFTGPFAESAFPHHWPLALVVPEGAVAGLPVELPFTPGDADAGNLRVRFDSGTVVPAQYELGPANDGTGRVVFVLPSGLTAGARSATVLAPRKGNHAVLPHTARFEAKADGSELRFGAYSAVITNGTLGNIAVRHPSGDDVQVVSQIIVSCKETGWSRETGEVEAFDLRHVGPVRAVFTCTKLVSDTFRVTREWHFYGDRFEVRSTCTPCIGTLTRTFYTMDGTATNQAGGTAMMDGKGDAEDFGFRGAPQWYSVFADTWNAVCIAVTQSSGFTYWDSGARRGQIALDNPGEALEKRVFILGTGADNDAFAKDAARAYAQGVRVQ